MHFNKIFFTGHMRSHLLDMAETEMEDGWDDTINAYVKGFCGRLTTMTILGLDLCFKVTKPPNVQTH